MDKRNDLSWNRQFGVKKEEEILEEVQESQSPTFVPLRLRINARYITYGSSSGEKYEFNGAGSVVEVREEDAGAFLAKRTAVSCCNGTPTQNIFEQVGE